MANTNLNVEPLRLSVALAEFQRHLVKTEQIRRTVEGFVRGISTLRDRLCHLDDHVLAGRKLDLVLVDQDGLA
jgi:hypothetical protein